MWAWGMLATGLALWVLWEQSSAIPRGGELGVGGQLKSSVQG